jgi:phthiodiolone/phenolphthiodiolone dimycocerosates ketoreductase
MILCEEHEECHKLFNSTAAKAYALISPAETYEKYGYKHPLGLLNAYKEYIPTKVDEAEILKAINEIPEEICAHRYLHGNVDEVIKQIEEYALKGLKHIVLWNLTPMCDYKKTKESFTSLLKVVEYFKDVR